MKERETQRNMSSEASSSSSPSGKRSRDPEDEVYVDNLHSHKRYLSEIMASSLNGLTVGESLSENIMESPARSESVGYLRDEVSSPYSPMSEDSEDSRYYDTSLNSSMAQHDSLCNTSNPSSPLRQQKTHGFSSPPPTHFFGCSLTATSCPQPRQRGSDSEGRFPSSPSDICHSADLRRAALLRSVQMRAQPIGPTSYDMSYNTPQEGLHSIGESEDRPLTEESEFQESARVSEMIIEDCSPMGSSESGPRSGKDYRVPNYNVKDEESREDSFEGVALESRGMVSSRGSELGDNASNDQGSETEDANGSS